MLMKNSTIEVLEVIKNGGYHTLTKDDDSELFEVLQKLAKFGILQKPNKSYSLVSDKMKYLSILIKAKNLNALQKVLEYEEKNSGYKNFLQKHSFTIVLMILSAILAALFNTERLMTFFNNLVNKL